ncbi:leucine-rich repeat domain-containing protein [Chamaesiphon sp. GL140_3_metabinner_50]|uniref:leucine-rich repeat domain-containing protein n=1 Tax=Chamaesiphon sp. GL140_3_metabinner_50 TaxID=2970812 RepID=UPI003457670E
MTDRELLDLIARARDEEWKELNLSYRQISVIPDSVGQLSNLRRLDLSGNDIEVISESIANLTNLQVLDFSYNHIKTIPSFIEKNINISDFYLNDNLILRTKLGL